MHTPCTGIFDIVNNLPKLMMKPSKKQMGPNTLMGLKKLFPNPQMKSKHICYGYLKEFCESLWDGYRTYGWAAKCEMCQFSHLQTIQHHWWLLLLLE